MKTIVKGMKRVNFKEFSVGHEIKDNCFELKSDIILLEIENYYYQGIEKFTSFETFDIDIEHTIKTCYIKHRDIQNNVLTIWIDYIAEEVFDDYRTEMAYKKYDQYWEAEFPKFIEKYKNNSATFSLIRMYENNNMKPDEIVNIIEINNNKNEINFFDYKDYMSKPTLPFPSNLIKLSFGNNVCGCCEIE